MENLIEIQELIENVFRNVPGITIRRIEMDEYPSSVPDLLFSVTWGGRTTMIGVECKALGEPRYVRSAIQQLKEPKTIQSAIQQLKKFIGQAGQDIYVYGVVAAPYISGESSSICKENGIGYIDLAGNCFFNINNLGLYVEKQGFENKKAERRLLRSIFSAKASRVLRVMLSNPKKSWKMQELSNEAGASLGLVFKVKERLLDLEYAKEEKRGVFISQSEELLEKWAENYSFRRNKLNDYFGMGDAKEIEKKFSDYCNEKQVSYGFTLFSGLALVAPYARYSRGFVYIKEKEKIQEIAETLGFKKVDSGANFTILEPYDEGVFYGTKDINGIKVVTNVQIYLDLVGYKGRGEESAKFLLEQRIKTEW